MTATLKAKCPCGRPVLRVVYQPSTMILVHAVAGKDGDKLYGCASSTVKRNVPVEAAS